ncbi:MAG TPA: peptide-methionine (S)-S-oxide reductase MsrA [Vicinamibacterales bacterium]|nr:peptide-methionine (S)-S-oxide reductase MsrA [Vicinamibacterales bacterium]
MRRYQIAVIVSATVALLGAASESLYGQNAKASTPSQQTATAIFAGGCFWCMEPPFDALPGVISTTSGYTAGQTKNPTYEQVSAGRTGHTEALQVVYDPTKVSYAQLLTVFWRNIDPLDTGGQFCDRGPQYRPGVYYQSAEQQQQAEASKAKTATTLGKPIGVEVVAASTFYAAEGYHQDYYKKNPVRYKYYRWNCGRQQRLDELWGKTTS